MRAGDGELFKGRHFDRQVIILCVRWYLSYKLSSRDLVEMMAERGLRLHTRRFFGGSAVRPRIREALEPVRTDSGRLVAL
jgi:hypothetical protein